MYSADFLNRRITIHTVGSHVESAFGMDSMPGKSFTLWANVADTRGVGAMQEGAIESYTVHLVRMRYNTQITADCIVEIDGISFRILPGTIQQRKRENECQFNIQEIIANN